jgi:predicted Zn-dependent peptidase
MAGASHFLEHLLFKGTPERSALDISVARDAVGGEFNAFTAKEYTCFHARVLDVDLPLAVDVLGDMITSSTLAPEDVEAEREVILDEIAMHDDDPEDVVANLHASLCWSASPLGRPIAGTTTSIEGLTRSQIERFYRAQYCAQNIVIGVAGNVEHNAVIRMVRKSFALAGFLGDRDALPLPFRASERFRRAKACEGFVERPFEQANLILGFNALHRGDDRRYALGVLNAALGGGPSSRLFQEVREHRGLAYSVYSYASHYADAGVFAVAAGCLPGKLDDVLSVVRKELGLLVDKGITVDELERGKGQLRGGLVLGLEDSAARMSRIAKAELLYDELPSIEEIIRRVDGVTLDEVNALAREIFTQKETLAVVGPASVA